MSIEVDSLIVSDSQCNIHSLGYFCDFEAMPQLKPHIQFFRSRWMALKWFARTPQRIKHLKSSPVSADLLDLGFVKVILSLFRSTSCVNAIRP